MEFRCHLSNPRKTKLVQIGYDCEIWRSEAETLATCLLTTDLVCENFDIFEDENDAYWIALDKAIWK